MAKIKLAIVDDHELFRQGLISLLNEYNLFEISFQASNGLELLKQLETHKPKIVLLDIRMPVMNGIVVVPLLKQRFPDVQIIYLTQCDEVEFVKHLIMNGGSGYLLKNSNIEIIVEAILTVNKNKFYFDCNVTEHTLQQLARQKVIKPNIKKSVLSSRECEILKLICLEFNTKEIADKLFISERTVDSHRANILEKIGARGVAGMFSYGVRHQLVRI